MTSNLASTTARLLSIGRELLLGTSIDTNAPWLCDALHRQGIRVTGIEIVDDEAGAIADALRRAITTAPLVLLTGGLGPTPDDQTRNALAAISGTPLREEPRWIAPIEERFRHFGRTMSPGNRIQARIPEGGEGLANAHGTAPGIHVRVGGTHIFSMPGVPHEMKAMFEAEVVPRLPCHGVVPAVAYARLCGVPESEVGERIRLWQVDHPQIEYGTTVKDGLVTIRAMGGDAFLPESFFGEVDAAFGDAVLGRDMRTLPEAVVGALRERGATLALAESCTGGMMASMLVGVPGASEVLTEGFVTYSNAAKTRSLHVPHAMLEEHGAVSEPVVRRMAVNAAALAWVDYAVAVSGIAGPGGGTPEKPVGTVWMAIRTPTGIHSGCRVFPGSREAVRMRATVAALDSLRRAVQGRPVPF